MCASRPLLAALCCLALVSGGLCAAVDGAPDTQDATSSRRMLLRSSSRKMASGDGGSLTGWVLECKAGREQCPNLFLASWGYQCATLDGRACCRKGTGHACRNLKHWTHATTPASWRGEDASAGGAGTLGDAPVTPSHRRKFAIGSSVAEPAGEDGPQLETRLLPLAILAVAGDAQTLVGTPLPRMRTEGGERLPIIALDTGDSTDGDGAASALLKLISAAADDSSSGDPDGGKADEDMGGDERGDGNSKASKKRRQEKKEQQAEEEDKDSGDSGSKWKSSERSSKKKKEQRREGKASKGGDGKGDGDGKKKKKGSATTGEGEGGEAKQSGDADSGSSYTTGAVVWKESARAEEWSDLSGGGGSSGGSSGSTDSWSSDSWEQGDEKKKGGSSKKKKSKGSGSGDSWDTGSGGKDESGGWSTATATHYTSYPPCCHDSSAEQSECSDYNGCRWEGYFAGLEGKQPKSWVEANNLVAVFQAPNGQNRREWDKKWRGKDLRLRHPDSGETMDVKVVDTCDDNDCSGCCTANAKRNGGTLIDLEINTARRFWGKDQVRDMSRIEWKVVG